MKDHRTRVLIAADESDTSIEAARAARELFGEFADYTVGTDETALWVGMPVAWGVPYAMAVPPMGPAGPPLVLAHPDEAQMAGDETVPTPVDRAEQQADEVAHAADLPAAVAIGDVGDAAEAILRAAETTRADVIVVGSHDRGWFSRLFSPSVSNAVVRSAPVPVLVVGGSAAA
jgi:nucleotide-binding universal stress UspA family protein